MQQETQEIEPLLENDHLSEYYSDYSFETLDENVKFNFKVFKRESKSIGKLAWPACLSSLLSYSLNFASVLSLGHLGKTELASSALATMFCNVTGFSIGQGLSSALDTLCAQAFTGSTDKYALGKHLQRAIVIMAFLCIPVSLIWLNAEVILLSLGQDPIVAKMSALICKWMLLGLFPFYIGECLRR